MPQIQVSIDMRKLWGDKLLIPSAIKAALIEKGVPVTEVTSEAITVSRGHVFWEWHQGCGELHVCWQDFSTTAASPTSPVP